MGKALWRRFFTVSLMREVEYRFNFVLGLFQALAEIFLPRAKRLAQATGARWPEEYERASVSHFERSVGVRLELSK